MFRLVHLALCQSAAQLLLFNLALRQSAAQLLLVHPALRQSAGQPLVPAVLCVFLLFIALF